MAMIADQLPPPMPLASDFERRVVVKFRPDTRLPYSQDAEAEFARQNRREWTELTSRFQGVRLSPYFSTVEESTLREFLSRTPRVQGVSDSIIPSRVRTGESLPISRDRIVDLC
jgi:hypothetical protein